MSNYSEQQRAAAQQALADLRAVGLFPTDLAGLAEALDAQERQQDEEWREQTGVEDVYGEVEMQQEEFDSCDMFASARRWLEDFGAGPFEEWELRTRA